MNEPPAEAPMAANEDAKPFSRFEWMIAGRYLRSRRREAFISVIAGFSFVGIMLGVATLIIVMAVMNGFRIELFDKILGISGHLTVQAIQTPFFDYESVSKRIEGTDKVVHSLPYVEGQALASGPSNANGVLVKGINKESLEKLKLLAENLQSGDFDGFDESLGIAIGTRLARSLGVATGDSITLVTPRGNVTPIGVTPRVVSYPVSSIFEIGMSEYDSSLVFMPLEQAQLYFNLEDQVSAIDVFVEDPDDIDGMREVLEEAANRPTYVSDWRQRHFTFFSALQVERNVMFVILTLIVLVAALNIISGLTMLVKDKSHDIAILRTMGAPKGSVTRIFVITGASIGIVGTLAGVVLGTVICLNIEEIRQFVTSLTASEIFPPELYYLSKLPARMDSTETISVIVMALFLSLGASFYPAWKAAKLDPVEALRYE